MLTRKRLRAYAAIIGATLWTIWLVDMSGAGPIDRLGKVKGTDFLHFYVMGSMAGEGRFDELFNLQAHLRRAQAIVPGSVETQFIPVESPQLALLFAPFAAHPYLAALAAWLTVVMVLYAGSCAMIWRDCTRLHADRSLVAVACAGFPGLYSEVLHGQTACLSLAVVAVSLFALRHGWRFAAGLAVGCLVFKPHWVAAAGAVFVFAGEWRVVAGAVLSAMVQVTAAGLAVGSSVVRAYGDALRAIPRISRLLEPQPSDSLKGYFDALVPFEPAALLLYAAAALLTVLLTARVWRSTAHLDVRLSALVLGIILICPHVNVYDLVLLAPVGLLLADWLLRSGAATRETLLVASLCVVVASPLAAGLPAVLRLQCSVGAMAAMLFCLWRIAARDANDSTDLPIAAAV